MRNRIAAHVAALLLVLGVLAGVPAAAQAGDHWDKGAAPIRVMDPSGKLQTPLAPLAGFQARKDKPAVPGKQSKLVTFNRYYAGLFNFPPTTVAGVGAQFQICNPTITVGGGQAHSLAETAAQSANGQQIVEAIWRKTPNDTQPRFQTYAWVNGSGLGYGSSFVPVAGATLVNGQSLAPTSNANRWRFITLYFSGNWWIGYERVGSPAVAQSWIGYYPGSLWGGTFTSVGLAQVFGEVATSVGGGGTRPGMGNDQYGSSDAGGGPGTPRITNTSACYVNSFSLYDTAGAYTTTAGTISEPTPVCYRWGAQISGGVPSQRSGLFGGPQSAASC